MVIIEHELPADIQIIITGDWHEGTILQERGVLESVREEVLKIKGTYWIHTGDWCEGILIDDKRYEPATHKQYTPLYQYQGVRRFIQPIRKKCLAALFGNHDYKLMKFGDMVRSVICRTDDPDEPIPIPYGTFTARLRIQCNGFKEPIWFYVTHGKRGINTIADDPVRRKSNMELILKRHLQGQAGDCLVMVKGHSHKLMAVNPSQELYLHATGGKIKSSYTGAKTTGGNYLDPNLRFYGSSGSALRLFAHPYMAVSGYAEMAEYSPTELGYLRATIRDGQIVKFEKVVVG
jgi:hypothetical protein